MRPVEARVEREELRAGRDQIIVMFEELADGIVPPRARHGRSPDVEGRQSEPAFDFENRFRLHQGALRRVIVEVKHPAATLP